ncbi:unnamed protein product [Orchesella dallaii]|uniref:E3 ubiquitin-protein ligase RNF25 n=1 Tax=Orchesella dallaii TaxID=48710 RepID=A0ABP1R6U8_9HEXA
MPTEACLEEFETLTAIFLDEIIIGDEQPNGETKVSMILFPATGDDLESKYVTLTLELTLAFDYPKVSPQIRFRNPRGLSETMLDTLYRNMKECCAERLESQMIFELIDMGKEFLTMNNRPASECPICLLSFTPCDTFFRSHCFHHFHSICLGRYLQNVMQVAASGEHLPGDTPGKTCPVCREILEEDIDIKKLLDSPPPFEESLEVADGDAILNDWHAQQARLKVVFEKQKSQGGIIDLSENDRKRLVISSPRVADSESPSSSSESGTGGDGELLVLQKTGAGANAPLPAHIPAAKDCVVPPPPPRTKTFHHPKEKKDSAHHHLRSHSQQNCQVKPLVKGEATQAPQDTPIPPGKTSPTFGRHHHGHHREHGRGKGGRSGEGRRRYK